MTTSGGTDSGTLLGMTNYPPPPPVDPAASRPEPPQSVLTAVRLMYAGAVLSLLSFVVSLFTMGDVREQIRQADTQNVMTDAQVDAAASLGIAFAVVLGLVGAGLWFWMARANLKGRNWARILATVFFGLNTFALLGSFSQNTGGSALTLVFTVGTWLVGLGAVVFMFRPESKPFYQPAQHI